VEVQRGLVEQSLRRAYVLETIVSANLLSRVSSREVSSLAV